MQLADIQNRIYDDLPKIDCDPGCIDCCTVALWTHAEWAALPDNKKAEIGMVKVPMRGPGGRLLESFLPVRHDQVIPLAMKKKMVITEIVKEGLLLDSFGLENIKCPFAKKGVGCTVYEYRPFVCRIMGAGEQGRMSCPRKIKCENPLPETIIMQRFLLWTNLFKSMETKQ